MMALAFAVAVADAEMKMKMKMKKIPGPVLEKWFHFLCILQKRKRERTINGNV